MCEINYFIKLLMFSTSDNNSLLLYGFCSATNQGVYEWNEYRNSKKNRSIWKSILNEDECKSFLNRLTDVIGMQSLISVLEKVEDEYEDRAVIIMEATAHYHQILANFFRKHNYEVIVINPIQSGFIQKLFLCRSKV